MDVVVADYDGKDIGVLTQAVLELSYGENTAESTFSLVTPFTGTLYKNCRIYVEGTEFGGLITGYKLSHKATGDVVEYSGYSWQGLLARHIVNVPSGQDRYTCGKSVNLTVLRLLKQCGVDNVFTFSNSAITNSNVTVNLPRYCNLYEGLDYYVEHGLNSSNTRYAYKYTYKQGMVRLSIEPVQQLNVDERLRVFYTLTRALVPVNHVVCLGRGTLRNREVVHLYADSNGNVSTTQTFTGLLENAVVYDYGSVEEGAGKLEAAGRTKFKDYLTADSTEVTMPENMQLQVGDVVTVTHPTLGITVSANVSKKIARVSNGNLRVTYTVGNDTTKKQTETKEYE